jgi:carbon storage regulator
MLVLSRKLNESIVIDGRITITVVGVHGIQIRLGIEAPKDVPVFRKELVDADAKEADQPVRLRVFS